MIKDAFKNYRKKEDGFKEFDHWLVHYIFTILLAMLAAIVTNLLLK